MTEIILLIAILAPTAVAWFRKHPNTLVITFLNVAPIGYMLLVAKNRGAVDQDTAAICVVIWFALCIWSLWRVRKEVAR